MCASFTASMELATKKHPGYEFIFHDELCDRIGGQLAFMVGGKSLKPDRGFAIRGPEGVVVYLLEVDRATEKNGIYLGKLEQYARLITEGLYKEPLKMKSGVVLINLMSNETHMRNVMKKVKPNNYMLFKAVPAFDGFYQTPPLMTDFFTAPWERVGKPDYFVKK
jgi:hypothetical protein